MNLWAVDRLALGTVQFGLSYGLASGKQKVPAANIQNILDNARLAGIVALDTASAYGQSEELLGRSNSISSFRLMSKTHPIRENKITADHLCLVQSVFDQTLTRLHCKQLEALLVHDAQDLLAKGADKLWNWMESQKLAGRVRRIGVSVYDSVTARILAQRYPIEIIQIPFNVFDQRIEHDGLIEFLFDRSVAIHARSIFLQGVAFMNSDDLPRSLHGLRPFLERFNAYSKAVNISSQCLALAYVGQRSQIEHLVIGIHDVVQLHQLIRSWRDISSYSVDTVQWKDFYCHDYNLLDPRFWTQ